MSPWTVFDDATVKSLSPEAQAYFDLTKQGALSMGHAYYVTRVDPKSDMVYVRNPWGWGSGETAIPFGIYKEVMTGSQRNSSK